MTRRVILCALLVLSSLLAAGSARAEEGKVDAQTFAGNNRYCGNGGFLVSFKSRFSVIGGTGQIDGNCVIDLIYGSKISFKDVEITGTGSFTIQNGNHASIEIKDSKFDFVDLVRLRSGCCSLIGEKSKIKISGSEITTDSSININASDDDPGGKVDIKSSTIKAGGGASDFVDVKASAAGAKGSVKIGKDSTLDATGSTLLVITNNGKTSVTETSVAGITTITAGPDGKCKSETTPPVPCS